MQMQDNPNTELQSSSSASAPKGRNLKRGRITNLIRERAGKKKALEAVELDKPAVAPADSKDQFSNKNATALPTTDPRFYYSRQILDAINSCDIAVLEEALKKYCADDVISSHLYIGELEHNPLGPNTRIIIGYDAVLEVWKSWFKIAPDSVFLYSNISGVLDKKTGVAISTTNYTCLFTRVLEGTPHISDEEVRRVEILRKRLLSRKPDVVAKMKSTAAANKEVTTNDILLTAVENNMQHIAQWRQSNASAKDFIQQTLLKDTHPVSGSSISGSSTTSTDDDIFGDATEAEIERLLDSFLDDVGDHMDLLPPRSGSESAGENQSYVDSKDFPAAAAPTSDVGSRRPIQELLQPVQHTSTSLVSSSSSAAMAVSVPAVLAPQISQGAAERAAEIPAHLKPLPKAEIVTYTYLGTFSVEVNPRNIITKMNFSFKINIDKSGGKP